jgi:hypothetical protein
MTSCWLRFIQPATQIKNNVNGFIAKPFRSRGQTASTSCFALDLHSTADTLSWVEQGNDTIIATGLLEISRFLASFEFLATLQKVGRRRSECVVLWLGRHDAGGTRVQEVYVPIQEASSDYFLIPENSMEQLFEKLRSQRLMIAAQVHNFDIHPAGLLLGACYAVGAVLKKALRLPYPSPGVLQINLGELVGDDLPKLYEPASFDEAHLAGAGAIGNGFLYGLSQFQIEGTLHICDDDTVSDGNLQHCIFFTQEDINAPKAERLCRAAREFLPMVRMIPHNSRLQDLPDRTGAWLKRLIVGVDSPRARRKLQSEIPGAVFDASTTGVSEVVFHFHRQPTDLARLSCIYHESPEEHAHEKHVAEALGISAETVKQERISEATAAVICKRDPQLIPVNIVGNAFDTLFKQLCPTAQLKTLEGRQVLAPFAFVSVLGGVLLAIEFVRRLHGNHSDLFNEWRVSPWANPVMRRQRKRERHPDCEFCADPVLVDIAHKIWS